MTGRCPFLAAVDAGELDEARRLDALEGPPSPPVVFDRLVAWAREALAGEGPGAALAGVLGDLNHGEGSARAE